MMADETSATIHVAYLVCDLMARACRHQSYDERTFHRGLKRLVFEKQSDKAFWRWRTQLSAAMPLAREEGDWTRW
jgi:hypothetical protein